MALQGQEFIDYVKKNYNTQVFDELITNTGRTRQEIADAASGAGPLDNANLSPASRNAGNPTINPAMPPAPGESATSYAARLAGGGGAPDTGIQTRLPTPEPAGPSFATSRAFEPELFKTPTIQTSDKARDTFQSNLGKLTQAERAFQIYGNNVTPEQYNSLAGGAAGLPPTGPTAPKAPAGPSGAPTAPALPPVPPPVNIQTANAALAKIVADANALIQNVKAGGGTIDPKTQAAMDAVNATEQAKTSALAAARTAADNGNPAGVNAAMTAYAQADQAQQISLTQLQEQLKPLREQYIQTFQPSAQEQQLKTELASIQNNERLNNIRLSAQTIPTPFIVGQQREMAQLFAAQEANILTQLGFEKEARELQGKSLEAQMGFITGDFELQVKMEDRINERQDKLLEQARELKSDQQKTLGTILDSLAGVGWDDLDTASQQKIMELATASGIPFGVIKESLNLQKQQLIFENAVKAKTSEKGKGGLTYEDSLKFAAQLRDDARQDLDIKVFPEVRNAYEIISKSADRKDAVGDLTLLRLYAKLTDPTSSVREEEFESMESAQGALARRGVRLTKGQITGERLVESARQQFVSAAKEIYEGREAAYENAANRIRANAVDAGVDPDRIITIQGARLKPEITDDEITKKLDEQAGVSASVPSLNEDAGGFFNKFLNIFGL